MWRKVRHELVLRYPGLYRWSLTSTHWTYQELLLAKQRCCNSMRTHAGNFDAQSDRKSTVKERNDETAMQSMPTKWNWVKNTASNAISSQNIKAIPSIFNRPFFIDGGVDKILNSMVIGEQRLILILKHVAFFINASFSRKMRDARKCSTFWVCKMLILDVVGWLPRFCTAKLYALLVELILN